MDSKQKAMQQWESLNTRQQKYLRIIYSIDQEAEQVQKLRWCKGSDREPASEWRWIFYGDIDGHPSRCKNFLLRENLVDQGTGSTFNALEHRGLIESRGAVPSLHVKMTRLGRQVIRAGKNEQRPQSPRTPKGMLSAKAWQALVYAREANRAGLPHEENYRYRKGIHLSVWDHLRRYSPPLVEEGEKALWITICGALFYIRHYQQYREAYPDIDAPPSRISEAEILARLRSSPKRSHQLVQIKRWDRSLAEVAAEIGGAVTFEALLEFENRRSVTLEQQHQILDWLEQ